MIKLVSLILLWLILSLSHLWAAPTFNKLIENQSNLLGSVLEQSHLESVEMGRMRNDLINLLGLETVVIGLDVSTDVGAVGIFEFGSSAAVDIHFKRIKGE